MSELIPTRDIPRDLIAVPISKAATLIGVSRVQFYKRYVWSGLLPTYQLGARGRSVKVDELRALVDRIAAEQREATAG